MKYELQMIKSSVMRTGIFFIFYVAFLVGDLFVFRESFFFYEYTNRDILDYLLSYLCYPVFHSFTSYKGLLFLFNMLFLVIYFTYFYLYENISIHNNVAIRYKSKKWVRDKYIYGIISLIIISLIEYLIVCVFMWDYLDMLNYKYLLYPFIFKVTLMGILYTFYNLSNTKFLYAFVFVIGAYLILYKFGIYKYIIVFIFTFVINYLFFDLRKYQYLNHFNRTCK